MIAISLRTDKNISYFKRNLQNILEYPNFSKVIICSGYFQEDLWRYKILNDGILSSILSNPNHSQIEYIIIAGKFGDAKDIWRIGFNNFLKSLKSNKINFKSYVEKSGKWHAKISIGIENGIPKTILMGSSNLTKPAFNEPNNGFNIEADILLIVNEDKLINHFNLEENTNENPLSQIVARINSDYNQANIDDRIQAINDEFLEGDFLEEYNDFE